MSDHDEHTLTVEGTEDSVRSLRGQVVIVGPEAGRVHPFEGSLRIGSRRLADLILRDPKVSALHLEVSIDRGTWVRTLGSKNGTYIAGIRIDLAQLPNRELVALGDTTFQVQVGSDFIERPRLSAARYHGLVGHSPPMQALYAQIARLAESRATVLVTGETGAGKERVAEALHLAGPRSKQPLEVVDCSALAATLIESELFGHVKGAFTDAHQDAAGAFERAHGGTLFLDEIGELPLSLQPKLLRVLEAKEVRRLGGSKAIPCDVRVVAATNRDLAVEVAQGRFREDLYYRLAVVTLRVPALRERREDVPDLAQHFLEQLGADPMVHLTAETLDGLRAGAWPGNVRQLRNVLERAVALRESVADLAAPAPQLPPAFVSDGKMAALPVNLEVPLRSAKAALVAEFERAYVGALLKKTNGNVSQAARIAGMDRMSIHRIARRLGLRLGSGDPE